MSTDNPNLDAEIRALLADGRKIEAIKRLREETGAGLADAKDAVEALGRGESPASGAPDVSSLEAEIAALLQQGRKIEAVKAYREHTGAGLKESKDAVEAIATNQNIVAPSGSGCMGALVLLVAVIAAIAAA